MVEKTIGYSFNNKQLLNTALTHSSFSNSYGGLSNERLEFLGDAVLELVVSEHIYKTFPKLCEGDMTKLRSLIVCAENLSKKATAMGLGECMRFDKGALKLEERKRISVLCDAFEALIGAIYCDGGFEAAKDFVMRFCRNDFSLPADYLMLNPKTMLQEKYQRTEKKTVTYRVVSEKGQPHDKVYTVDVFFDNKFLGRGIGKSKKEAEQEAARDALSKEDEV